MSNNFDIQIYDFENVCRTCLSAEDLKPLYEKYSLSTCLVDMLTSITVVKFTEDDGLPVKICANCIKEINKSFSFAKLCETTDTILRKYLKTKIELANNSSQSQEIEVKEENKIEIKPEIISVNTHRTVQEVLENFEYVEHVKQEEVNIKFEECLDVENVKIKIEYDETDDDPLNKSQEKNVNDDQNEIYSEEFDNSAFTNSQTEEENSKKEVDFPLANRMNKNLSKMKPQPRYYKCKKCFEKFTDFKDIRKHQEIHNETQNGTKEPFCSICSKTFTQTGSLKIHSRLHTGEKPHICSVCTKTFIQSSNLKVHMRSHTGEKPFTCEICNKAFTASFSLKKHMRTHTGEKVYVCSVCNKAFTQYISFKFHMRMHSGERPYSCEVCSKAFVKSVQLKQHIKRHTGARSHACSVCSKTFSQRSYLQHHMRIHTGEKPFACGVCSKAFTHSSSLKFHMSTHTGKKS